MASCRTGFGDLCGLVGRPDTDLKPTFNADWRALACSDAKRRVWYASSKQSASSRIQRLLYFRCARRQTPGFSGSLSADAADSHGKGQRLPPPRPPPWQTSRRSAGTFAAVEGTVTSSSCPLWCVLDSARPTVPGHFVRHERSRRNRHEGVSRRWLFSEVKGTAQNAEKNPDSRQPNHQDGNRGSGPWPVLTMKCLCIRQPSSQCSALFNPVDERPLGACVPLIGP